MWTAIEELGNAQKTGDLVLMISVNDEHGDFFSWNQGYWIDDCGGRMSIQELCHRYRHFTTDLPPYVVKITEYNTDDYVLFKNGERGTIAGFLSKEHTINYPVVITMDNRSLHTYYLYSTDGKAFNKNQGALDIVKVLK